MRYPVTEAATGTVWALLAAVTQPVWLPVSAGMGCATAIAFTQPDP